MVSNIEHRQPVFIGEILTPGLRPEPITVRVQIPDAMCGDCAHPASLHPDGEWDASASVMTARCTACGCGLSRLEAAGWTPPNGCAGQCG